MASRTFTGESSATNLNSQFYLQNFYKSNRSLSKASVRSEYDRSELSYEDSRALKRAAGKLSSFSYSDEDNGDNLVSSIEAFIDTYNNALDSSDSKDDDIYHQHRKLKTLTNEHQEELEELGITIGEDGKLSVNENLLKTSSFDEVKSVFSKESDYIIGITRIARQMHAVSSNDLYGFMTGNGGMINIQL